MATISLGSYAATKYPLCERRIPDELYRKYNVYRGLRDERGKGVMAGITNVSTIYGKQIVNGEEVPAEGILLYRGYALSDLVAGESLKKHRLSEECAYLLLFGELPTKKELTEFSKVLAAARTLPRNFTRDVIMKAPSNDVMNSIIRSVLTLASYDKSSLDTSMENVLRQSLMLIATMPMLAVYAYQAYNHYIKGGSLIIHRPDKDLSWSENLLMMLRPDKQFTELEARVLDLAMVLHMEHGGGNNSTFTTHVVTSTGSDTYSTIAAALASLKGPKHGGANLKAVKMMDDIRKHVRDIHDDEEIAAYLRRILNKDAFDKEGLIYGMGHAVYSLSDPRTKVFESFVESLAREKGRDEEYELYAAVERIAPEVICEKRRIYKGVCPNVDFLSGFVYRMLGIPDEMFTPIFAIARMAGWSAHRMEELANMQKIIRPAFKSIMDERPYVPIGERK
ncbi:MAG: citrate/2-methylcitrate synthase [Firmicutes bacterium]|nr:citrate/2-methylcitrate synthase [Bacillota bacterium]